MLLYLFISPGDIRSHVNRYNEKADTYSFGMLLWEMAARYPLALCRACYCRSYSSLNMFQHEAVLEEG
jgi:hypothetical protein